MKTTTENNQLETAPYAKIASFMYYKITFQNGQVHMLCAESATEARRLVDSPSDKVLQVEKVSREEFGSWLSANRRKIRYDAATEAEFPSTVQRDLEAEYNSKHPGL